jgi:hypothetical protein
VVDSAAGVRRARRGTGEPVATHILSLTPFRRIVKDYFMICDSYYEAIKTSTPSQIEAIDMGRRGLHNDGSQTLMDRLEGKISHGLRHGPAAVHAGLRAALARLEAAWRKCRAAPYPTRPPSCRRHARRGAVCLRHERHPLAGGRTAGQAILCRAPMSSSAGVRPGERDPFVDVVLAEIGP